MKKRGYVLLAASFLFSLVMLPHWWMKLGLVMGYSVLFFFFHRLPIHDPHGDVAENGENH